VTVEQRTAADHSVAGTSPLRGANIGSADIPSGTTSLPPDVIRDARGRLLHVRLRFRGFVTEDGQPWTSEDDGPRYEEHDEVPHPCSLPPPYAEPDEVERLRRRAVSLGQDFLHPEHGWLTNGRKRSREWPENLGTGSVRRSRRRQQSPLDPELPTSVRLVERAPIPEAPDPEPAPTGRGKLARPAGRAAQTEE
jgi:hypothetical protein